MIIYFLTTFLRYDNGIKSILFAIAARIKLNTLINLIAMKLKITVKKTQSISIIISVKIW